MPQWRWVVLLGLERLFQQQIGAVYAMRLLLPVGQTRPGLARAEPVRPALSAVIACPQVVISRIYNHLGLARSSSSRGGVPTRMAALPWWRIPFSSIPATLTTNQGISYQLRAAAGGYKLTNRPVWVVILAILASLSRSSRRQSFAFSVLPRRPTGRRCPPIRKADGRWSLDGLKRGSSSYTCACGDCLPFPSSWPKRSPQTNGAKLPYEPVAHGKLEGLDYQARRPFINWRRPDLLEKIQEWVALNPPRLELATLAYEELRSVARAERSLLWGSFQSICRQFPGWPLRVKTCSQN